MLLVGDKIRQKKEMPGFNFVGKTFRVSGISVPEQIFFSSDMGCGIMSYEDFDCYFEKVEKKEWSSWRSGAKFYGNKQGVHGFYYKTNGKKVVMKMDGYKASASCAPCDEFSVDYGVNLCFARINLKRAQKELSDVLKRSAVNEC